ncbi:3-methyl-2-oxobutanoate hydroxymethyltransferase [Desulfitobacterium sp.]|uniref:3-methyl-2-oxobutanoate hydroxymethyltransferase n=1 Tax=Desulfitobacterium sp. TaxID=49981 RepID=UPI002BA3D391|nr:3-methyl-2-oxobutanoate hydroxymethyltransferase [Desulfitobacterium sp.]HVJ48694.1 3-methyl-2-oxobutanoate hydroxymethyltransferase [Desulfitobacterium sp.]
MRKTVPDFFQMKAEHEKISMLTAYDYPSAHWAEEANLDMILVGDSLGMVILGYDSTVPVTMEDMIHHAKAVRRGAPQTFVIVDMPYMSYPTVDLALKNAGRLIQEGGADGVKLEGGESFAPIIKALTQVGIPVMGHIGLTPQTATQLGGFKVQGRDVETAKQLMRDAHSLEKAGVMGITLEAIPAEVAKRITREITVPTIGIGAGKECDGQVLVIHDMLGMFDRFKPKFVRSYADIKTTAVQAISQYITEVKEQRFPASEHEFSISQEVVEKLYGKE